ncbi:MAG: LCP family protein [Anaerolineae bacterium]|nr:LCP family protein [Anaerolineae bacterium]
MRIPTWFVMLWVIGIGVVAIGAALVTYGFVRARAGELDELLALPDPPQIGHPLSIDGGEPATDPTAAVVSAIPTDLPTPTADSALQQEDATLPPPTTAATDSGAPTEVAVAPENAAPENTENGDVPAAWDDPRRVSVLLLGIDQRKGETGPFLTDTIILLSMDPLTQTAAILSIPRDLWVEMPGLNYTARINSANRLGDEINYPGGGGPVYAMKVVEQVLGLNKIDYFVLINFEVFTTLVDAIGPIEVCPNETIHDEQYPDGSYGYTTVHFDPGCQDLGAERLLQYARVRHNDSDIKRSERQQEVILAVRDVVLSAGGVLDLLPQAVTLWESVQDNIHTNLTFEEMISLARAAQNIPRDNIRQGQITFAEVEISQSPDGDDVLVPIGTDIRLLVEDLFRPAGEPSRRE